MFEPLERHDRIERSDGFIFFVVKTFIIFDTDPLIMSCELPVNKRELVSMLRSCLANGNYKYTEDVMDSYRKQFDERHIAIYDDAMSLEDDVKEEFLSPFIEMLKSIGVDAVPGLSGDGGYPCFMVVKRGMLSTVDKRLITQVFTMTRMFEDKEMPDDEIVSTFEEIYDSLVNNGGEE